jgi:hypothetical protein
MPLYVSLQHASAAGRRLPQASGFRLQAAGCILHVACCRLTHHSPRGSCGLCRHRYSPTGTRWNKPEDKVAPSAWKVNMKEHGGGVWVACASVGRVCVVFVVVAVAFVRRWWWWWWIETGRNKLLGDYGRKGSPTHPHPNNGLDPHMWRLRLGIRGSITHFMSAMF